MFKGIMHYASSYVSRSRARLKTLMRVGDGHTPWGTPIPGDVQPESKELHRDYILKMNLKLAERREQAEIEEREI